MMKYPVWVEISKSALYNNIEQLKKNIELNLSSAEISGVIKSNAYGHGMNEIALLTEKKVDWFCVNSLWEGIELIKKTETSKPVLIMGYTLLEELENLIEYVNLRQIVYNFETLEKLKILSEKYNRSFIIHLKLETGTGRQGFQLNQIDKICNILKNCDKIILEGASTHFANIEDTTDHSYYKFQLQNFNKMIELFKTNGFEIPVKHTACTAACILFPETYFNLIRPGIGLYGLWPSKETYLSCILNNKLTLNLKPVLSFKTKIAQIKILKADSFIGYGCSYKTTHDTKIAVLPVGYFDGYDRKLSNQGFVIIRNKRAPIIGRICMNICMVDVTHIPDAQLEDEVILLGKSESETISAEMLAQLCNTINYEIVTKINPLLPRIIVE